jgi:acetolactate synthase I/II/III large subunit
MSESALEGHGGTLALTAARAHGVERMFTLSGAHVFPLYDAAVHADPPMPIIDVRHEQTAVFAAEATAKLTRRPGLAVLTAGPGVTNGVSAVTSAYFNASPVLVVGGRAPAFRWGSGALQELDHPPLLAPVTKYAGTVSEVAGIATAVDDALRLAQRPHRGPVFLDVPMDQLFSRAEIAASAVTGPDTGRAEPDPGRLGAIAALLGAAQRPVLVLGSDVWADGAEDAARRLVDAAGLPVIANGMGRGIVAAGHPLLVTRARSRAFGQADLVIVVGTPLDFRLGYGIFGGKDGAPAAPVVHLVDAEDQVAAHCPLAGSAAGDLGLVLDGLREAWEKLADRPSYSQWTDALRAEADAAVAADAGLLSADAAPLHPARIYGELVPRLADDAVVIGDGGDFVSFAGRFVEPARPGGWLDPGPYGCLGTGMGYAMGARVTYPDRQICVLMGDGAAGFSLMDVESLARQKLPVVIVVGNNGIWGLEKHPMKAMYGYDVAADLQPGLRYDDVVTALGGGGETVTEAGQLAGAFKRAFDAGVPYLVNVLTDPEDAYPRSANLA